MGSVSAGEILVTLMNCNYHSDLLCIFPLGILYDFHFLLVGLFAVYRTANQAHRVRDSPRTHSRRCRAQESSGPRAPGTLGGWTGFPCPSPGPTPAV